MACCPENELLSNDLINRRLPADKVQLFQFVVDGQFRLVFVFVFLSFPIPYHARHAFKIWAWAVMRFVGTVPLPSVHPLSFFFNVHLETNEDETQTQRKRERTLRKAQFFASCWIFLTYCFSITSIASSLWAESVRYGCALFCSYLFLLHALSDTKLHFVIFGFWDFSKYCSKLSSIEDWYLQIIQLYLLCVVTCYKLGFIKLHKIHCNSVSPSVWYCSYGEFLEKFYSNFASSEKPIIVGVVLRPYNSSYMR